MSSPVYIDNKGKDILILDKGPTQGLNHMLTAESQYSIIFTRPGIKFCFSLHYDGSKSILFVNTTKNIYQFKAKDSEIKKYPLCLGNISKDFTANNMKKRGLNRYVYKFSVDFIIDTSNVIGIHKYLIKKYDIK